MTAPVREFPDARRGQGPLPAGGPVIVLSYAYAGAGHVQDALAAGTELACTSGTGIIPLCATAAESWRRVEGRDGPGLSGLAAATIRGLVLAQVTALLAADGKTRWCELATAQPSTAEAFAQVFPHTRFVCVHRRCLDVVGAALRASPWGPRVQGLTPYLLAYPGNNVAAVAASWADSAEQLLAFERAHRERALRIRYEDVTADPVRALTTVRASLGLASETRGPAFPGPPEAAAHTAPPGAEAEVPAEMIPDPLHQRVSRLHAELDYPPIG